MLCIRTNFPNSGGLALQLFLFGKDAFLLLLIFAQQTDKVGFVDLAGDAVLIELVYQPVYILQPLADPLVLRFLGGQRFASLFALPFISRSISRALFLVTAENSS